MQNMVSYLFTLPDKAFRLRCAAGASACALRAVAPRALPRSHFFANNRIPEINNLHPTHPKTRPSACNTLARSAPPMSQMKPGETKMGSLFRFTNCPCGRMQADPNLVILRC
jgi:hypothetical protein